MTVLSDVSVARVGDLWRNAEYCTARSSSPRWRTNRPGGLEMVWSATWPVAKGEPMTPGELRSPLSAVRDGQLGVDEAAATLAEPAVGDLGFATLDLHRKARCGFPEVILAEGKTAEWVAAAVTRLREAGQDCFATRVGESQAAHLRAV